MATYSLNTTIKLSGAVFYSGTPITSTSIFDVPSGYYAIIQLTHNNFPAQPAFIEPTGTFSGLGGFYLGGGTSSPLTNIYVGPGMSLYLAGADYWNVSGVMFKNSP